MSAERAFLDTNVLVYVFDRDEPAKAKLAKALLEQAKPDELALSAQVLGEFYVTVTRKLSRPLDADTAGQVVDWLSLLKVVSIDSALVKEAGEISRSSQISYLDGLIVASAASYGCRRLLTEDLNDGQVIAGVRIEDPFQDAS
jgi:predicted nucleic acid-binding protein